MIQIPPINLYRQRGLPLSRSLGRPWLAGGGRSSENHRVGLRVVGLDLREPEELLLGREEIVGVRGLGSGRLGETLLLTQAQAATAAVDRSLLGRGPIFLSRCDRVERDSCLTVGLELESLVKQLLQPADPASRPQLPGLEILLQDPGPEVEPVGPKVAKD